MHLIYARFITKVLRDCGLTKVSEPFKSLVHQGLILGPDGNKMSKSKGNVISPDDYVNKYGSDVFRMYLMFGFSYVEGGPWSEEGVNSMAKFIARLERIIENINNMEVSNNVTNITKFDKELLYVFNNSLKGINYDLENMQFNTAIAKIMEITNALYKYIGNVPEGEMNVKLLKDTVKKFIKAVAPFMPHFAEEMWEKFGEKYSVFNFEYPNYDEKYLKSDTIQIPVQINGVVRYRINVSNDLNEEQIEKIAKSDNNFNIYAKGKNVKKVIVIKSKIVNIVLE